MRTPTYPVYLLGDASNLAIVTLHFEHDFVVAFSSRELAEHYRETIASDKPIYEVYHSAELGTIAIDFREGGAVGFIFDIEDEMWLMLFQDVIANG